jgi:hypothetical protein
MSLAALQTIAKLTKALAGIRDFVYTKNADDHAKLNLIFVIANETLNEVAPEIERIKVEVMAFTTTPTSHASRVGTPPLPRHSENCEPHRL